MVRPRYCSGHSCGAGRASTASGCIYRIIIIAIASRSTTSTTIIYGVSPIIRIAQLSHVRMSGAGTGSASGTTGSAHRADRARLVNKFDCAAVTAVPTAPTCAGASFILIVDGRLGINEGTPSGNTINGALASSATLSRRAICVYCTVVDQLAGANLYDTATLAAIATPAASHAISDRYSETVISTFSGPPSSTYPSVPSISCASRGRRSPCAPGNTIVAGAVGFACPTRSVRAACSTRSAVRDRAVIDKLVPYAHDESGRIQRDAVIDGQVQIVLVTGQRGIGADCDRAVCAGSVWVSHRSTFAIRLFQNQGLR